MKKGRWFFHLLFVLLVLEPIVDCNISFASSDLDSVDYIHFPSGATIYSPLNKTYYSNSLDLNLTFGAGLGISHYLNYSIDGKYQSSIPLIEKFPDEFHIVNIMTGIVTLPEFSDGSHFITINVLCRLNDYHGANPPGLPFQPTFSGSSNYIATWTHTIYFSIDTSNTKLFSLENWGEVITFAGSRGIGSTKTFVVDHVDWRINWEFEPGNGSERVAFLVYVFQTTGIKGSEPWTESIQHFGTEETTGILNIYNQSGYFYMDVLTGNIENYSLVIEQNLDSIPEFPAGIIIPLFLIGSFSIVFLKKYGFRIYSGSS